IHVMLYCNVMVGWCIGCVLFLLFCYSHARSIDVGGDIEENIKQKRNALLKAKHWIDGVVNYELDTMYNEHQKGMIRDAMHEMETLTKVNGRSCLTFREITSNKDGPLLEDYVYISPEHPSCNSDVGMKGGKQTSSLGLPCLKSGKIMHEMMHVLGFMHEQARNDRDDFVDIVWKNIKGGHEHNFKKMAKYEADTLGLPYDYGSILHYSEKAFAKHSGLKTIVPKSDALKNGLKMGQRVTLSEGDVKKVQTLYNCL
ncbi:unnamed protein product, partial [Owenia fusiformis]